MVPGTCDCWIPITCSLSKEWTNTKVYTGKWIIITLRSCTVQLFVPFESLYVLAKADSSGGCIALQIYQMYVTISCRSTAGGSNGSIQYSMSPLWSHEMSRLKNLLLFVHMQHVDHKGIFIFFSFWIKNIFPSVTLTRNLTGTLAESYFALALTLKYSMNFKLNEMHWEVGVFFFFVHAFPSIYYVKEISAKKSWCCSWPQNRQPFNHFMPLVFIRRYLNPRGLDNFAT